jgi:hypothetical protein
MRPLAAGLTLALIALPAAAQQNFNSAGAGQYNLAVTTGTKLTVPSGTRLAQICVNTAGINYTSDGITASSSTVGIPVAQGTCFQFSGPLGQMQFSAQSGAPTLSVEYFK